MAKKLIVVALVIVGLVLLVQQKSEAPTVSEQSNKPSVSPAKKFNPNQFSRTDPNSQWVVVNKKLPLVPNNYAPTDLTVPNVTLRVGGTQVRQVVIKPLQDLFAAAKANGTPLRLSSAYRSYSYQVGLYNGYVSKQGQQSAEEQSARPGHSEHQTGLAVDVSPERGDCEVEVCFADTPSGKWVAANAHKYGFIVRYDKDLSATTGYSFEPWHLRYIGVELAAEMQKRGVRTLEEFFSLPAAPTY